MKKASCKFCWFDKITILKYRLLQDLQFLLTQYNNEWKKTNFDDKKINKSIFCKNFHVDDTDVNKLLVSKKEPYSKKNAF